MSDLRILAISLWMVTCCCEQFTIAYGLLRAIYGKINLWTFVRFLDMYKNLLLLSRILTSVYELLRIITSYLRIPASYLQMLAIEYEMVIRKQDM